MGQEPQKKNFKYKLSVWFKVETFVKIYLTVRRYCFFGKRGNTTQIIVQLTVFELKKKCLRHIQTLIPSFYNSTSLEHCFALKRFFFIVLRKPFRTDIQSYVHNDTKHQIRQHLWVRQIKQKCWYWYWTREWNQILGAKLQPWGSGTQSTRTTWSRLQ